MGEPWLRAVMMLSPRHVLALLPLVLVSLVVVRLLPHPVGRIVANFVGSKGNWVIDLSTFDHILEVGSDPLSTARSWCMDGYLIILQIRDECRGLIPFHQLFEVLASSY